MGGCTRVGSPPRSKHGRKVALSVVLEPSPKVALALDAWRATPARRRVLFVVADARAAADLAASISSGPARAAEKRFVKFLERTNAPFRATAQQTRAPNAERKLLLAEEDRLAAADAAEQPPSGRGPGAAFVATRAQFLESDLLRDLRPDRVVLVDAHPDCARVLEAHAATTDEGKGPRLEVYAVAVEAAALPAPEPPTEVLSGLAGAPGGRTRRVVASFWQLEVVTHAFDPVWI